MILWVCTNLKDPDVRCFYLSNLVAGSSSPSPTHHILSTNIATGLTARSSGALCFLPFQHSILGFVAAMSSRRSFSCLQINILNVSMGGNSLQSETEDEGSHISPANHQQPLLWSIYQTSGHSSYFSGANTGHEPIERRVEAQTRIRRKLDEACANAGSIFGIDIVAQLAMDILSLVEVRT